MNKNGNTLSDMFCLEKEHLQTNNGFTILFLIYVSDRVKVGRRNITTVGYSSH